MVLVACLSNEVQARSRNNSIPRELCLKNCAFRYAMCKINMSPNACRSDNQFCKRECNAGMSALRSGSNLVDDSVDGGNRYNAGAGGGDADTEEE